MPRLWLTLFLIFAPLVPLCAQLQASPADSPATKTSPSPHAPSHSTTPPATRPMNASENQNEKYYIDDEDDITLEDIMSALFASSTGDKNAAMDFEAYCRQHYDRDHVLVGKNTTTIVRGSPNATDTREHHCIINTVTQKAVLKPAQGPEITLTINNEFIEIIKDLRRALTNNADGDGPEIVLDETTYIDLADVIPAHIRFDQLAALLTKHLPPAEQKQLQQHAAAWTRLKHEHTFSCHGTDIQLVACDAPRGKLYFSVPSLHIQTAHASRTVELSRYGKNNEDGEHTTLHPAPAFFDALSQFLAAPENANPVATPPTADEQLTYPDEKSFSANAKNDKTTAQFEHWHNTAAINALLRALIETGGLQKNELAAAKQFVRQIPEQRDLYCMFIKGGTLQIVCLGAKNNITQCIIISKPARTIMINTAPAPFVCPLTPEYEKSLLAILTEYKKSVWMK